MDERYVDQVRLLLRVLPDIAAEDVFALKGGTAINLFYREMPRLSVDIDLAYLPVEEREKSLHFCWGSTTPNPNSISSACPMLQSYRPYGGSCSISEN